MKTKMQLYPGVTIVDEDKFVKSHKTVIKNSKSKLLVQTHKQRLEDYYKLKQDEQK